MSIKTSTSCFLPIFGCLEAAQKFIRNEGVGTSINGWQATTDEQKAFLAFYGRFIGKTDVAELKSKAHSEAEVINRWLATLGYSIRLDPNTGRDSFAVASVLDLLLKWIEPGTKTTVIADGEVDYAAVKIKKNVRIFENPTFHLHPVAKIDTQSGDTVCMTMVDENPKSILSLVHDVGVIGGVSRNYEGVIFPMIDLDDQPDISWLCGMGLGGWTIDQAKQQTKFRMNEIGAKVESAAAMTMKRGISFSKSPMVIDRPFLLWIERKGLQVPIFAGILAQDCWKEPK